MIIGTPLERMFRMLRSVNTLCASHATRAFACLVFILAAAAASADVPTDADVRPAFAIARDWVDAFNVPQPEMPESAVPIDGATGVCVVLRRSGRVVGVGTDWTGDDLMLRRAVGRALSQLLAEPVVQRMSEASRVTVGPLVSIELEVAGTPQPIVARSFEQAGRQLDPGVSGIAMRRERDWQMIFPAQLRANNTASDAHRQYLALAADLKLPAVSLDELTSKHHAAAYSFDTLTLMQSTPSEQPVITTRGESLVSINQITPTNLHFWASACANHLLHHLELSSASPVDPSVYGDVAADVQLQPHEPLPVGLSGTYNPLADEFNPIIAPPVEQALGVLALDAAAQSPFMPDELRKRCADAVLRILRDLAEVTERERDPLESAATCAVLVAAIRPAHTAADPAIATLREAALKRIEQAFIATGSFDASLVNPHDRALVAWALARLCASSPLEHPRTIAESAIDQIWKSVPANQRVALLPWIGWAERDLATPGAPLAHQVELAELLQGVCASRIMPGDAVHALDLTGGIPFVVGGRQRITSQSLRAVSWIASAVRDERLVTQADRNQRMAELREMLRFARQLMVRSETTWRYRNNDRSIGGFRESTWDLAQPIPAQALGLITLLNAAETLQTAIPEQPADRETRKAP